MSAEFLVHHPDDNVAVIVIEGVTAGQALTGASLHGDETYTVTAAAAIPLGHKIALAPAASGDTVIKYGHDIGKVVAAFDVGDHVHVHNLKTKRW